MKLSSIITKDYENKSALAIPKNKAKQSQSQRRDEKNRSGRIFIDRMKPLYPVRKPALWAETVFFAHLITEPGSNTPAELSNGVYKPVNDRYYSRSIGRCSSMVEHSFRKAGVEGPNPSIGCVDKYASAFTAMYKALQTMAINDTPKEIREFQYELYRMMSPAKKMGLVFDACEMGRILAMAGIRMRNPSATEGEVRQIWRKQHLGEKLYNEVYGNLKDG